MPIDARIALGYQPIQLPDQMAKLRNRLAIDAAAQDTRVNALKLAAAEREMADEERVRNYFAQNPNATIEEFASQAPGFGSAGMARLKGLADYRKEQTAARKTEGELFDQEMARSQMTLQNLDPNDPAIGQKLVSWHLSNHSNPILGPRLNQMGVTTEQSMQAIGDAVQRGPKAVSDLLGRMQMGAKDFAAAETARRNAATSERQAKTSEGNLAVRQKELKLSQDRFAREGDLGFQSKVERMKSAERLKGESLAKAEIQLPSAIANAETQLNLIDQMIGKEPSKAAVEQWIKDHPRANQKALDAAIARGEVEQGAAPHPGFSDAVGAGFGSRFFPGTDAASFQSLYEQATGAAFLQAYETLRGTGQIATEEGKRATAAITRMQLAQSEKEFVKAAREFQGIIKTGVENAKKKAGAPSGPSVSNW